MLKWLRRDPRAAKKRRIAALLEQARDAQRSGDIARYAELVAESEAVAAELGQLEEAAARGATG